MRIYGAPQSTSRRITKEERVVRHAHGKDG